MTRVLHLSHDLAVPAADAFALVADVRTHGTWVPLTRVELAGGTDPGADGHGPDGPAEPWEPAVGAVFAVVSGPGARRGGPGFVDRMRITAWQPPDDDRPGLATFRKLGPVLLGTAGLEVRATSASSSRVVWWEDVHVTDVLPASWTSPVAHLVLRAMIRAAWPRLDAAAHVRR
ncbi:hypothetical protein [Luteimicrobium subarcticum]|uniref:Polyketide cyclase/dehydrase/lipid transport protein n=1 Tax=Luteimicrobium subarcticum TaxID=620910 RepID=A0A2M8WSX7_9MICO|nr:hypothetical protein [Luteimicrobium subarcticum]PJI94020.1 hypothetical protein CLV34_1503 [Luteimicrobium subarcticum]